MKKQEIIQELKKGGGCLDRQQMQELRGHIFEYLNAQLPKCIKEKGAAK